MSLDDPGGVVGFSEVEERQPQFLDGVEGADPQQVLLQGADEPFGDPVTLGLADEERTQPLLQQAREFNLGVILSHQKLADLTPTLRATFAGNTSSKYCGNPSADDARDMAKEMRTDAGFVMSQNHKGGYAHFAAYIRGLTPRAVSYPFKLGTIADTPKMTDNQYAELIARNRAFMSPPQASRLDPAPPAQSPQPQTLGVRVTEKPPTKHDDSGADDFA